MGQMNTLHLSKCCLQIWHGYTTESPLNSHIQQLSLHVFDAMLELFKHVVELFTYACISPVFRLLLSVGVWVFGEVLVFALSPNDLTVWVAV